MKVTKKTIKRLIETGAAHDVTNAENFKRPCNSTVVFYSVGDSGVNAAVLVDHSSGELSAVVGRSSNLFIMIR